MCAVNLIDESGAESPSCSAACSVRRHQPHCRLRNFSTSSNLPSRYARLTCTTVFVTPQEKPKCPKLSCVGNSGESIPTRVTGIVFITAAAPFNSKILSKCSIAARAPAHTPLRLNRSSRWVGVPYVSICKLDKINGEGNWVFAIGTIADGKGLTRLQGYFRLPSARTCVCGS